MPKKSKLDQETDTMENENIVNPTENNDLSEITSNDIDDKIDVGKLTIDEKTKSCLENSFSNIMFYLERETMAYKYNNPSKQIVSDIQYEKVKIMKSQVKSALSMFKKITN
jgi:hypothetical protein